MKTLFSFFCIGCLFVAYSYTQPTWDVKLDSKVGFYQSTDFGILLAGTENSLYAIDGQTGSLVWRRKTGKINETAVTPVPNTDLILFSRDLGSKSRLEAVDILSGFRIWESEKVLKVPSSALFRTGDGWSVFVVEENKAYRREVLDGINLYGEMHRFVPALASQFGARVAELPVNHFPRLHGVSKYGISRTLRVILDLMTVKFLMAYSTKPIQLFGKWGIYTIFAGLLTGTMTLYMKFYDHLSMNRNPLLIVTAFLLFMGVQFIVLGLLGELNARTYFESQGKPIYTVKDRINLD